MNRSTFFICLIALCTAAQSHAQNLNIIRVSQQTFPHSAGGIQTLANVGGYVDEDGNEYALVCAQEGLIVMDISDPANPVQKVQVPGPDNLWREVKVYKDFAYVTTEAGGGLQIIDLSALPDSSVLPNHYWTPNIGGPVLNNIHALHVDTALGFVYCFGGNMSGAVVGDLNTDPYNPVYVGGYYAGGYIHDGFVNNDTLYAAHIFGGYITMVDMTDKSNPVLINTLITPGAFPHNVWPSDDRKYFFTTDEVCSSYLTAYDISDLTDIKETDRIQSNSGSQSVVHNTHIRGDFAVTSWYKDGVTIVDVSHPDILVQVGNYDLDSLNAGCGYSGTWGVYPYFPSGNMVASNLYDGTFSVLAPEYVHGSYLQGTITDCSGFPLDHVVITIVGSPDSEMSDLSGEYDMGNLLNGYYDVQFFKPGFPIQTVSVNFIPGIVQTVNIVIDTAATITLTGRVKESGTGSPIEDAQLLFINGNQEFNADTDAQGNFAVTVCPGVYDVYAGAWGYLEKELIALNIDSIYDTLTIHLDSGYADDFILDLGWTSTGSPFFGWQRGDAEGTNVAGVDAQTEDDVAGDFGADCYATGLAAGYSANEFDVDDASVILTSPFMDLSTYNNPYIRLSRWFFEGGANATDQLFFALSDGVIAYPVNALSFSAGTNAWNDFVFSVSDFVPSLANPLQLIISIQDFSPDNITEAAIDDFMAFDSIVPVYPPVADFMADQISVCPNENIQFTDLSTNNPNQWSWSFPGAVPDTSNNQNPIVSYPAPGTYDVTLTVTNGVGNNTITQQAYITVLDTPEITNVVIVDASCVGCTDGSISLTIGGCDPPYIYGWSNGMTSETILNVPAGSYSVTIVCANGCASAFSFTVGEDVGIENISANHQLTVYPNPFSELCVVSCESCIEEMELKVFDVLGKEIYSTPFTHNLQLSTLNWSPGVYFIRLINDGQSSDVVKMIKAD